MLKVELTTRVIKKGLDKDLSVYNLHMGLPR